MEGQLVSEERQEAFERYVIPEIEFLLRVAVGMTRNLADAEDVVQETLLRSFRAIGRFDGRHPRAWLITILRNANANRARKLPPQPMAEPGELLDRRQDPGAGGDIPEKVVVDEAFDGAVAVAFASLPEKFRRVVDLVDIQGLTYSEAAETLSVPVGTVMSRLHRGRAKIRAALAAGGFQRGVTA